MPVEKGVVESLVHKSLEEPADPCNPIGAWSSLDVEENGGLGRRRLQATAGDG